MKSAVFGGGGKAKLSTTKTTTPEIIVDSYMDSQQLEEVAAGKKDIDEDDGNKKIRYKQGHTEKLKRGRARISGVGGANNTSVC